MTTAFNPNEHIIMLKGKMYVEVKWRLVWLRSEHPDASIVTEMLRYDEREAVFRAVVTIPGGGTGVGHGSEKPADFGDYCEKAETKAIGRALGALGYGTQFVDEHEMGGAVVDSPVQRATPAPTRQQQPPAARPTQQAAAKPAAPAEKPADQGDDRMAKWIAAHLKSDTLARGVAILDAWLTREHVAVADFRKAEPSMRDSIMELMNRQETAEWLKSELAPVPAEAP